MLEKANLNFTWFKCKTFLSGPGGNVKGHRNRNDSDMSERDRDDNKENSRDRERGGNEMAVDRER